MQIHYPVSFAGGRVSLTKIQLATLAKMEAAKELLVYVKGGYWTVPSSVTRHEKGSVPKDVGRSTVVWSIPTGTMQCLARLGLLKTTQESFDYPHDVAVWNASREMTDLAKSILAEASARGLLKGLD